MKEKLFIRINSDEKSLQWGVLAEEEANNDSFSDSGSEASLRLVNGVAEEKGVSFLRRNNTVTITLYTPKMRVRANRIQYVIATVFPEQGL